MSVRPWLVVAVLAVSAAVPQSALAQTRARYVDVTSYITSDEDFEAWFTLTRNLAQNFDDICGDTFCEGDYSNIQSLRYRCSVNSRTGVIGQCVWVFAASNETIDPATGQISVETQTWQCVSPLAPRTRFDDFLAALAGPEPLYATLPGTSTTLYEGLIDCL